MIHIKNLTKYYGDFCAVDHISFDIKKGEVLGILGPNGAGKTSTLRMLTGYFLPNEGDIIVKGQSIFENLLKIKEKIGYLPESAPLYHAMFVYDYLDYVANIRGLNQDKKITRIKELVGICGLSDIMHKTIGELSKGLKQRVGLAHAMMNDPEILILDEPTSGLDPNQIIEIREIIRKIGKEKTVVLSTHILSEVEVTCDRVIIINKGKIVADGDTKNLQQKFEEGQNICVSLLDANFDEVKEKLGLINGVEKIKKIKIDEDNILTLNLITKSSINIRKNIYKTIKDTDWILMEFYPETQTLENIFRELTKET